MMEDVSLRWPTLALDVSVLGTGGIILLICFTAVTPTRRGFYCDDESIRYPFKNSTVPNYLLYIYGFIIPLLVIIVTEFVSQKRSRRAVFFLIRPCPLWLFSIYRSLIDFLFGVVVSQLATDVGKYSIGRLRPNFIDVCKPNVTLTDCAQYGNRYIENYICTGSNDDAAYSRVSFPSGHSSFSAYTMLYTAIFIQVRWRSLIGRPVRAFRLVKHGVQILLIILAYFTALSRVMDNKHHWSDAMLGSLIGLVVACLTAKYVSKLTPGNPLFPRVSSKEINGQHQEQRTNLNSAKEEDELGTTPAQGRPRPSNEQHSRVTVMHTGTETPVVAICLENMDSDRSDTDTSPSTLLLRSPETSIN